VRRGTIVVGLVVLLVGAFLLRRPDVDVPAGRRTDASDDEIARGRATGARAAAPAEADRHAERKARRAGGSEPEDMETPWAAVDLHGLQVELPDNLYWKMAVPTKDQGILDERQAERDRWNVEYGKILSNTATPDEIDTYYAYRYRLSSDYIQVATIILADYGDELEQKDVGLLKVAIELHMARLEEIPRQIEEAHERCAAHERVRQEWLASQKAFAGEKKD
jgi:hypothetical protein